MGTAMETGTKGGTTQPTARANAKAGGMRNTTVARTGITVAGIGAGKTDMTSRQDTNRVTATWPHRYMKGRAAAVTMLRTLRIAGVTMRTTDNGMTVGGIRIIAARTNPAITEGIRRR